MGLGTRAHFHLNVQPAGNWQRPSQAGCPEMHRGPNVSLRWEPPSTHLPLPEDSPFLSWLLPLPIGPEPALNCALSLSSFEQCEPSV